MVQIEGFQKGEPLEEDVYLPDMPETNLLVYKNVPLLIGRFLAL
jgi:hypothetical protein